MRPTDAAVSDSRPVPRERPDAAVEDAAPPPDAAPLPWDHGAPREEKDAAGVVAHEAVVTRVELSCEGPARPRMAFDERGGLDRAAGGTDCVLRGFGEGAVAGSRAWVSSEAGRGSPPRGVLDETGAFHFRLVVRSPPPVDVPPAGPSPLDGVVTLMGVVEGAEAEDLDEPYVDADDDGEWGADETFWDTNGDQSWTAANGALDDYALLSASLRLRWVGPARGELSLACDAPDCSPAPIAEWHAHCEPADHYLAPGAALRGEARVADRNGQCTALDGHARLFIAPPEAATLDLTELPLGPCPLTGLPPEPFTLTPKRPGTFTLLLGLPDGRLIERRICR